MRIVTGTLPGSLRLTGLGRELSPNARRRLKWMDYYQSHGHNARLTCRHFDISPQTFYRWRRRYDPRNLGTLEDRCRRPHRRRQPTWSPEVVEAVRELRERKPRDYQARQPGDLVQVDTLDLRPLPGVVLKHFTARDVLCRWDVLAVRRRATATTATAFLEALQERMPFPVKALQVDGGSEFQAAFEAECQRRQIRLFVLPPRSPKLNGQVERAHRTHTEEFYECYDGDLDLPSLRQALLAWERTYNTVRPHQALGYRTPQQFLQELAPAS